MELATPAKFDVYDEPSNVAHRWERYVKSIKLYLTAKGINAAQRCIARMQNEQAQDVKLALLNAITRYCMEHSICRQQIIAKYFDDDGSVSKLCNTCDVCQKEEVPEQVRDCTQEASDVLECLTSMMVTQSRVKVVDLVMTYMGSKAKDVLSKSFHMVPQYGKGKSSYKNISVATQFIHFMIFEGFLKENLPNVEARGSLTFVTHGNIVSLLNSASKVFFFLLT